MTVGGAPSIDWIEPFVARQFAAHPDLEKLSLAQEKLTGYVVLFDLVVKQGARKRGTGTAVMEALAAEADTHGCGLVLTPDAALGASSTARLYRFYARFGFVKNRGRRRVDFQTSHTMIRLPRDRARPEC